MNKKDYHHRNLWNYILLFIPILFLIIFFVFPLFTVIHRSLDKTATFLNYRHIFENYVYIELLINTFKISLFTTLACFIVGFPFARILSGASNRKKIFMLGFVLFPLITPILIRTFGWMILLQNKGVINTMLLKIGIVNNPINMMFNFFGNMVGLVQVFLPYTILILYDAFRKIDESQILAARTLGAKPFRIFWKIELPQLYSGIFASNAIVFILSAGAFITPAILGGRKETMVSQVIQDRIIYGSFPFAASLSVVFLVTIILFVYVFEKTIGIRNVFKEK